MSVLRRALETRSTYLPVGDVEGTYGWGPGMVWRGSPSGTVGTTESMRLSAVFACLRLLSEAIATLPLDTFTREDGNRLSWPRPEYLNFGQPGLSKIDYLSQVMLSLLTDGNAYVYTPRTPLGEVISLFVLDPTRVTVSRKDGRLEYRVSGVAEPLDPRTEIMHIKGMCMPGDIVGISPIAYAAETVGVGLNAQRYGSAFFNNGASASFVLRAKGDFSKTAQERWLESWNARHQGAANANRVGVLTNDASLEKISINPDEAQFLETRQFTVPDIARIYGVPPHLIADASNSTSWGSGLAEQNIAFGQFSLRPWTERIEEAHGRLLTLDGMPDVFLKLNMDAVLRASLEDRYQSYAIAIINRFMTINEARKLEDLPPVAWGDEPRAGDGVDLPTQLQKIYLAVGKVITPEEAREILNRTGADLGALPASLGTTGGTGA